MMRLSRRSALIAASLLILIAGATYLFFPSALPRRIAKFFNPIPSLAAYRVDPQETSVSGVSSGAAMAVQIHIAHSSIMRGVGVIAGVAYDCVDSRQAVALRVLRGLDCIDGSSPYGGTDGAAFSVARTTDAASVPGAIDDPVVNLPRQKVWLFSGYNDGEVRRPAMDSVALYYGHYIDPANIFYKTNSPAPHALVTNNYGGPCLALNPDFINNCSYDAAGRLLEHIYGHLDPPVTAIRSGQILAFDQGEFVPGHDPNAVGLADTGYVYVPADCLVQTCRAHIVFHGCQQYAEKVGDAVYRHGGYNEWADNNRIIVLYPQTHPTLVPVNPKGCFDWWGLSQLLPRNAEFARKTGYQITAFKAMLDRLAQNFTSPFGSGTFGTPQNFKGPDSTPTSVELVWEANTGASGFNVYRSDSSTGPFNTKLNTTLQTGASFSDQQQLLPNTTYYYQVKAVNQFGTESGASSTVTAATTGQPPPCDPYFSNNVTHELKLRAYADPFSLYLRTKALGSNNPMGWNNDTTFTQLIKQGPGFFRNAYCP
jgi:hypothetical protein